MHILTKGLQLYKFYWISLQYQILHKFCHLHHLSWRNLSIKIQWTFSYVGFHLPHSDYFVPNFNETPGFFFSHPYIILWNISTNLYGLSRVWVRICFLRSLKVVKYFVHPLWIQLNVSPLWSLWCALNLSI